MGKVLGNQGGGGSKYLAMKGRGIGDVGEGQIVEYFSRPRRTTDGKGYLFRDNGTVVHEGIIYVRVTDNNTLSTGTVDNPQETVAGQVYRFFVRGLEYSQVIQYTNDVHPIEVGTHFRYEVNTAQAYDQNGRKKGGAITDPKSVPKRGSVGLYGDITLVLQTAEEEATPEYAELVAISDEIDIEIAEMSKRSAKAFAEWQGKPAAAAADDDSDDDAY